MKRFALGSLFASAVAVAVAYAAAFLPGGAPVWAVWLLAVATATMVVATMMLGATKDGRIGALALPFGFVFVVLAGGFALALALPPADPADPTLWLGLPPRAAIILYGIGLLPFFVVPVAYALSFDPATLSDDDLRRVREAAQAFRASQGEAAAPTVVPATEPRQFAAAAPVEER